MKYCDVCGGIIFPHQDKCPRCNPSSRDFEDEVIEDEIPVEGPIFNIKKATKIDLVKLQKKAKRKQTRIRGPRVKNKFTNPPLEVIDMDIPHNKYISRIFDKYTVKAEVNGRVKRFGLFDKKADARNIRNHLLKSNWDESLISPIFTERNGYDYIWKWNTFWIIYHDMRGKIVPFGVFKTLKEAKKERDYLESVDWSIKDKKFEDVDFENIKESNGVFYLFNEIDGKEAYFGQFLTVEEARNKKKMFVESGWDQSLVDGLNPEKKFIESKGKNYNIVKVIDGKKHIFGTFSTLIEAQDKRDFLIDNNWEDI